MSSNQLKLITGAAAAAGAGAAAADGRIVGRVS